MAELLNEDFSCVLCESPVSSKYDLVIWEEQSPSRITQALASQLRGQSRFTHKDCIEAARQSFPSLPSFRNERYDDFYRRLWLLSRSKSQIWPLNSRFRQAWVRRIAGRAIRDCMRQESSGIAHTLYKMPGEIVELIGEYCFPSALTRLAILHQSVFLMASVNININGRHSRNVKVGNATLAPLYRNFLQHRYVTEISVVDNINKHAADALILCSDGIACRDIVVQSPGRFRTDLWYRWIQMKPEDELYIVYKVRYCASHQLAIDLTCAGNLASGYSQQATIPGVVSLEPTRPAEIVAQTLLWTPSNRHDPGRRGSRSYSIKRKPPRREHCWDYRRLLGKSDRCIASLHRLA